MDRSQQATFQRFEKKYLLSQEQYDALTTMLGEHLRPDRYFHGSICSLYFDTPDYQLIRTSLEKPVYKEKLRLRSYGTPGSDDTIFLEIKKKYRGIVYKRRVPMTLAESDAYLSDGIRPKGDGQILREIDWFRQFYGDLRPAILLSYDRDAYVAVDDPGLRVTFDCNICWRRDQLRLDAGPGGKLLLPPNQHLMELKIPSSMPLWLSHALDALQLFPTSFSKYGTVYQTILAENNTQGGIVCA